MNRPVYNPRKVEVDIPDRLRSNEEIEYFDEEDFEDDVPTYRSINEATAQNGYIDISKEIGFDPTTIVTNSPRGLFYDLSEKDDTAKQIAGMVTKSEEEKKAEKKREWGKLLAAMNTREDEYAVCANLSIDNIFDFLKDATKMIDEVYAKFTKSPLKTERHHELLDEVLNDLIEEEKTIEEYKEELKKLG